MDGIRAVRFDHPDAVKLSGLVQAEYVRRYGYDDMTPLRPGHFDPPDGLFLVAYLAGAAVGCGGWRVQEARDEGYALGDAELKRMFVVPEARGRGIARGILRALEDSARDAGRVRMVLETGTPLHEAMGLYVACGYAPTANFGPYRGYSDSRCFAKAL
ncbi:GNAT family N-acetyltransferase [Streptomyces muensis]|uniref:GNAT family N-acetyltransferase n=1 Tax=Streptomyces muensis TaxID=1077944 RepID=A0A9X1Q2R6_STRM4|nr:GNAT family N-acetyltransferase [Streptomyces muensis]MCF1596849.1 GNAT family N-acetyltransferase [Streptomyces muensis]